MGGRGGERTGGQGGEWKEGSGKKGEAHFMAKIYLLHPFTE